MEEPSRAPTTVTWCEASNRIGMRGRVAPLDETCRYCKVGEVRRRTFPTRASARRFVGEYRQTSPIKAPAA